MNLVTTSEYDFIGQEVSITQSKNNEILGIKGKVIMETKNMIILNTGNGTSSGNDFPMIDYCAKSGCIALGWKNGSNFSMRAIGVNGNTLTEGAMATTSDTYTGTSFALSCGNANDGSAGPMTGGLFYGRASSAQDLSLIHI